MPLPISQKKLSQGELQRLGPSFHESFWVRRVCGVERDLAECGLLSDSAVVNIRWCVQRDPAMPMLIGNGAE